jgi:hypothetical protein
VLTPLICRAEAARRFGVSVAALGVALNRLYVPEMIPRDRPGLDHAQRKIQQSLEVATSIDAVDWIGDGSCRTIREAAAMYDLTETTVRRAWDELQKRPPTTYDMIRWLDRHPNAGRYDACDIFGFCYGTVCQVMRKTRRYRRSNGNTMTAAQIADAIRCRWPMGRPKRRNES